MDNQILSAVKKLDVTNDAQWTPGGLPQVNAVRFIAQDQTITREAINAAAPGFTRDNPNVTAGVQPAAAPAPVQPAQPVQTASNAPAAQPVPTATPEPAKPAKAVAKDNSEQVLKASLTEQAGVVSKLLAEKRARDAEYDQATKLHDELANKLSALQKTNKAPDTTIQDYLASQSKALQERAAKKQLLKDSGLDLKELARDLKSPIDAAMSRKNARGAQRPGMAPSVGK